MTPEQFVQYAGEDLRVLFQALIAMFLGGVVGWEREAAGKWAGFRTHMMVCVAAMLFVKVGQFLIVDSEQRLLHDTLQADPVRIIEAIVTGVAFLGAGLIFRDVQAPRVRGLTTAASLLMVAPIGIAVAIDRYVLAFGTTLLALLLLRLMRRVEKRLGGPKSRELHKP